MADRPLNRQTVYATIRNVLAERIAKGEWKPRSAIPNEGELAREFGVSLGTMRKALELLEAERLVTRQQGRGTFVNDHSSDELAHRFVNIHRPDGRRIVGDVKSTEVTNGVANERECERLGLQAGDRVHRLRRIRFLDESPFMLVEASMPFLLFPGFEEKSDIAQGIVGVAQSYGLLLGKAEERINIRPASASVAEALNIAAGSPVAVLDRVVRALDGQLVEWRMAWCQLDENYYLVLTD